MSYLLVLVTAMVISMALIPLAARMAPAVGMIDRPDARKVHAVPIPRVGGIGIVIGALVPMVLVAEADDLSVAFAIGGVALLLIGAWDDVEALDPYVKLLGQIVAAALVVYYGDLYVRYFPFLGHDPLPAWIGQPFTVFALVGAINALNTSDGLDGLAGGESVLSLAGVTYLAYQADGVSALMLAAATIGGVFGFLRYNSHPARVFMGDSGSQFLGFALGTLVVLFTQRVNTAASPAIVLFLLGLPIMDLIVVMVDRARRGMKLMRPTRTHLHHRLLDLGLDQAEAVTLVYFLQAALVVSAAALLYERDWVVMGLYVMAGVVLFGGIALADARGRRIRRTAGRSGLSRLVERVRSRGHFIPVIVFGIEVALAVLLLGGAMIVGEVTRDFGIGAAALAGALALRLVFGFRLWFLFLRLILYVAAAFVGYLVDSSGVVAGEMLPALEIVFYALMAAAIGLAVRYGQSEAFRTTPTDFLVLTLAVVGGLVSQGQLVVTGLETAFFIKLIILFYGCEIVLRYMRHRVNLLTGATLLGLVTLAFRGLT